MMKTLLRLTIILLFTILPRTLFADDFTLGADISWLTEMESKGEKLYNYNGEEREATLLMKEMGLKAVRLRVWVNPSEHGGWCGKEDVLEKAKRAKAAGMDVMIDFHYSDWWADPAKQNIPKAWEKHKYKQLLLDVTAHTTEVLQLLKDNGISPRWVQIGNETSNGFLWPAGKLDENPNQYAGLFKAGYEAAKKVVPQAIVMVHLDKGYDDALYRRNLDALKEGGAQWDMIGMSLYPYWAKKGGNDTSAFRLFGECVQNINALAKRYGTDVMITETGFEVNEQEPWVMESGRTQLAELIRLCKTKTHGHCKGIFYWEPTYKPTHYKLGAFTSDGRPTAIMRAFTTAVLDESLGIQPEMRKEIVYDRKRIRLETTVGVIVMELYNETPLHRDNYLKLAKSGVMEEMLIHRVVADFMIQMGDPASKTADQTSPNNPATPLGRANVPDEKGQDYTIPAELMPQIHFHKRGAVAAARADDKINPEFRSSSSQFYITYGRWPTARIAGSDAEPLPYYLEEMQAGVPYLDGTYTVFGEVIQGMDVVEKIQRAGTDEYSRPITDIRIVKFQVVE